MACVAHADSTLQVEVGMRLLTVTGAKSKRPFVVNVYQGTVPRGKINEKYMFRRNYPS